MARENTLKALKSYGFSDSLAGEESAMSAELAGQSDRAAFILLATRLDNALAMALQNVFRRDLSVDQKRGLFDFQGPAGSFSGRIKLAYALRIIDRDNRVRLDILREIRNVCAHSPRPLSLGNPELADAAKLLFTDGRFPEGSSPRTALVLLCFGIERGLLEGIKSDVELLKFLQDGDV